MSYSGIFLKHIKLLYLIKGRDLFFKTKVTRASDAGKKASKDKLEGKELELLIAILPDNNGSLYGDLKRICETDLGLISQCYLIKHVFKVNRQYLANVALKINVKMGGRNIVLLDVLSWRIPLVSDIPIIIFGADVTHPESREDSCPSIAANMEFNYNVIQYIFRDGVSEGQFYQVLLYELDAIRKVLWWTLRSVILLNLTSTCAAMQEFRYDNCIDAANIQIFSH
ncbi:hypothetical protein RJT34_09105 [Clitoria ternatea]|uniref:Piwi domain-containing protein n=1 Tax=Clitoria ternatea TaxID=43366 RepID=A0AAN9K746_CLITE